MENKTEKPAWPVGRYLKYAIGEIVLVVIGILIALQINNWNEHQKYLGEETTILNNLLENLKQAQAKSLSYIEREEKSRDLHIVALGIHADSMRNDTTTISRQAFKDLIWSFESAVPVINTYSDIKSTGKLSIIQNRDIRESFNGLELAINELNGLIADRLTVQQMRVDEISVHEINFIPILAERHPSIDVSKEVPLDYKSILSKPLTRNLLGIKLELTIDVLQNRRDLAVEIDKLIDLLEAELEQ